MPTSTMFGASLAGALVALSLSACGSSESDGFTDQSVDKIGKQAEAAMNKLSSVRLAGDITSDGQKIRLDLAMSKKGDCSGSIGLGGATAQILVTDGEQFMKGDQKFWEMSAGGKEGAAQIVAMVKDKWAKVPTDETEFGEFCDLDSFLDQMKDDDPGKQTGTKGKVSTIGGRKAIEIKGTEDGDEGRVWVAVDAPHYMLELEATGKEPVALTFSDFDEPVKTTKPAPADVFDFSKLR